jgi:hypothetical protein
LESLNIKIDGLSSSLKDQLGFNKMLETQLAQLAALVPFAENGKISGQPMSSCENVSIVSTTWGKTSMWAYVPNYAERPIHHIQDPWEESAILHKKVPSYSAILCTIYYQKIKHALCDLGENVNIMSKTMFGQLGYPALSPTMMQLQLADSSIQYPSMMWLSNQGATSWSTYEKHWSALLTHLILYIYKSTKHEKRA